MTDKIGVIHEIGDLGLGFTELNDKDKSILKEQEQKENKDKETTPK